MEELIKKIDPKRIYELTKTTPNDMLLGEEIRKYIYELQKT